MKKSRILMCVVFLSLLMIIPSIPTRAYTKDSSTLYFMYVNDQQVGIVKYPAMALSIYDTVERREREKYQEEVFIDSKIYFAEANATLDQPTHRDVLAKAIEKAIDVKINSISINIDGTKLCNVKDIETAQKLIDDIKAPYIEKIEEQEDSQLEDISIKQDIDFKEEIVSVKNIISLEEAMDIILQGNQEFIEYQVQEGDSLWSIAHQNNVSVTDLELINPQLDDEIIQPGDIIKIGQQKKLLTVVTKEKIQYSEEIPFETEVREDNSLEKGKTKVIQQGEKGQKDIVALVTKEDGQEIARDILEEKIVKEPVKHIEAKGTKVKPRRTTTRSSSGSSTTIVSRGGSGSGSAVVNYAMNFKGYKYVYGASGPNAFDCSGFTKYGYGHFGVDLPRTSSAQRSAGKAVSRKNLQPGDLLCFPGHVGIYIGNNKFIHAANRRDGVKVSSLSSFNKPLITARRIFN